MPATYPPAAPAASRPSGSLPSPMRIRLPRSVAYALAFFLFGTLNNVLYVVILSAALDLVDKAATPKGLILFVNIAPALLVKVGWPYFVPGQPRYKARVVSCSALSFAGILIVAFSDTLFLRLLGISIASFSSGLGEMTFLQLSTVYGSLSVPDQVDLGGTGVGWFSSGTGAAGLVGAGLWWILRGLGVRTGLLICSILPLCMALTYLCVLPSLASFRPTSLFSDSETPYAAVPSLDDDDASDSSSTLEDEQVLQQVERQLEKLPALTMRERFELARPLLVRFMLPLFFVYLAEYTINSGVAPTLLYEVPRPEESPVLALMIKNLRDYYPLWQLLYQTFVFVSRSSLSILHLPPLPIALLPLPTLLQLCILFLTMAEATTSVFVRLFGEAGATWVTAGLVCAEGLCGGAAYVNCYYWLGADAGDDEGEDERDGAGLERGVLGTGTKARRRRDQEKEFRIASVGFADTSGIMVASLVSSLLEPRLCASQVSRGRTYCHSL
ncbi:hypothetical protein JCM10212_002403 [Sporobolomyces blumeae]